MKHANDNNTGMVLLRAIVITLLLTGLISACAPQPETDAALRAELERLRQQQKQQQETLQVLQQQLAQYQQLPASRPLSAGEAIPEQTTASVIGLQPQKPLQPQAEEVEQLVEAASRYLEAFSALSMGRYEQAREAFSTFVQDYTEHRYAPNARYWLAEAEISLGLLQQAEQNLLLVANDPTREDKAPAALSRLSMLYRQQNLTQQAEDILHQLRVRFPESREAQHLIRSDQNQ